MADWFDTALEWFAAHAGPALFGGTLLVAALFGLYSLIDDDA